MPTMGVTATGWPARPNEPRSALPTLSHPAEGEPVGGAVSDGAEGLKPSIRGEGQGVTATFQIDRDDAWPKGAEVLPARCAEAVEALGLTEALRGEVSVLFATDDDVRALNRDWRGKDTATNVLSFPADDVPGLPIGAQPLGDLALAWETVAREAEARAVPPLDHTAHLIVHGLLHLLGYDHRDGVEARDMEALETRALAAMGLHAPYDEEPAD